MAMISPSMYSYLYSCYSSQARYSSAVIILGKVSGGNHGEEALDV
jgi:hypothetical protein